LEVPQNFQLAGASVGSVVPCFSFSWKFWGTSNCTYYLPRPIPRALTLEASVVAAISEADAAVGATQRAGQDPELLIGPYLRREALASSRIEGTQASLSEVFTAEIDASTGTDDTTEVLRYLAASDEAFRLVEEFPITQRLILRIHRTLLTGVRGEEKRPGELRTSPVWVGPAGATPNTAVFVPPLPHHLSALLGDWERFVNDDGRALPPLVQAALMHSQFETIHPFLDGNGRIGRLLISVLLKDRGRLEVPLLYLSHYFETHRTEYYERLQAVRERAALDEWLVFFMEAVRVQAIDAVERAGKLVRIREKYLTEAMKSRSRLPSLVEVLFHNPVITVHRIEHELNMTNQGARALIQRAQRQGWLQALGARGQGGRLRWYAPEILSVISESGAESD
jgi:Fic family protein